MGEMHLALAEELERLAAGDRALAKNEPAGANIHDISFILNEKMSRGKMQAIKTLLRKYGAEKLVEVKEEDYKDFYKEAKEL